jgi:tetratricopeptide (TPR) repeat protein
VRPSAYANLGYTYYYSERLDEAAAAFRRAISLSPERPRAHFYLGRVLLAQGDLREALIEIQKEPMDYFRLAGLALVYHALGDSEASERALANLIDIQSESAAFQIAEVYAFRGENDSAFEWLQKAYDTQDAGLAVLLGNPLFAELTYDARYHPFVEKLGLLPYWQEMRPSI